MKWPSKIILCLINSIPAQKASNVLYTATKFGGIPQTTLNSDTSQS